MGVLPEQKEPELTESQVKEMSVAFQSLKANHGMLVETLADIELMLDAQGWLPLFDFTTNGLSKSQLDMASRQLRELVIGNPMMKKGASLKHDYAFDKWFKVDLSSVKTTVRKQNLLDWVEENITPEFTEEWTRADFTDGQIVLIGDNKTHEVYPIPVEQITGVYVDPDNHRKVIAMRRSWLHLEGVVGSTENAWMYLSDYKGTRSKKIQNESTPEDVDTTKTIFWNPQNRQVGWTWGTPDALSAIAWSRLYREFMENGYAMTKALAKIAYKLTSKTASAQSKATAQIANTTTAGMTAGMSSTMDINPLSSAGKGYDFKSGEALAQQIASAINVALEDLLSQPKTDNTQGVPTHVKRATRTRQRSYGAFLKKLLVWAGAPTSICVTWPEIDDMDVFRKSQMQSGAWGTGLFDPEEVRPAIAETTGIPLTKPSAPSGVMLPNNKNSAAAGQTVQDTTTDGLSKSQGGSITSVDASQQNPDGSNSQTNGQGRDTQGIGQTQDGNNDLRDGTTKK